MHQSLRPLLLATGAFFATALTASAQFIELLTEAPVTFQVSLTTQNLSETATSRSRTAATSRFGNADIINELRQANIIPAEPATGWTLVAVRDAAADLAFVDAAFALYAINGDQRIAVPQSKFASAAYSSVERYTERHQGQYVLTSKGTVTNHVGYEYLPSFAAGGVTFTLDASRAEGFATVSYATKDLSAPYDIFFYSINSVRVTALGSFTGERQIGENPTEPTAGLISVTISVDPPKLVPASLYPDVPTYPGLED